MKNSVNDMEGAKKDEKSAGFWKRAKELLSRSVRARRGMNLSRLSKITKSGQTVVVADKVLGSGSISHPITIAALGFSEGAKEAIKKSGGKIVSVDEIKKKNPDGKNISVLV
ncbi:MAG: 50S ribosomal protein L18e [Candidatus Micrarchaeota archaeon]